MTKFVFSNHRSLPFFINEVRGKGELLQACSFCRFCSPVAAHVQASVPRIQKKDGVKKKDGVTH